MRIGFIDFPRGKMGFKSVNFCYAQHKHRNKENAAHSGLIHPHGHSVCKLLLALMTESASLLIEMIHPWNIRRKGIPPSNWVFEIMYEGLNSRAN
jgi:hypothetical protein